MAKRTCDVVVIGGGPGGYVCSIRLGQLKQKVICVEKEEVGGVCLNWGCVPSKALIAASHTYEKVKDHGAGMGIIAKGLEVDSNKMQDWKAGIVKKLTGGVRGLFKGNGVELVMGNARITGPRTVEVKNAEGATETLEATKAIVVATGSSTIEIPTFKFDGKQIIGAREAVSLREVPKRLLVIGGGVIGLELGNFFAEVGAKVTVLEMLPQALAFADPELARALVKSLESKGVTILTGARATDVQRVGKTVAVTADIDGTSQTFEAEEVLLGAGRIANLSGVEQAGFASTTLGITVDERMRTSVKGVWAIGDCIGDERSPKLAHVASTQGEVAVDTILGEDAMMRYDVVPNVVYTHPELAQVGLTEAQAKARHQDVKVARFNFRGSGRALALGDAEGLVKLVTAGSDQRIVGVGILGPQASEVIATAALAMRVEATVYDVVHTITAHPTLAEAFREAALSAAGTPIHSVR